MTGSWTTGNGVGVSRASFVKETCRSHRCFKSTGAPTFAFALKNTMSYALLTASKLSQCQLRKLARLLHKVPKPFHFFLYVIPSIIRTDKKNNEALHKISKMSMNIDSSIIFEKRP